MTNIDFISKRYIFFTISIVIFIAGVIGFFVNGLKYDIDFKGGTSIQINIGKEFDNIELSNLVKDKIGQTPIIQKVGADEKGASISINAITEEQSTELSKVLKEKYSLSEEPTIQNIQPAFGKELVNSALKAIIAAVVLILIYVIIRFAALGATAGIAAIIALIHDLQIMLTVYIIFQIPINSVFIAALLTIVGYSINDTIIVYDRIRENRRARPRSDIKEIINLSINQTMARSIFTVATVVVCVSSILVFAIINNQQILKDFSFPLVIGLISGAYSSVCIASPLWYIMMKKDVKKI